MNKEQDIELLLKSPRYHHMKHTRKLAVEYGRCKEQWEGKCMYPHCGCLFSTDGFLDPVSGKVKK